MPNFVDLGQQLRIDNHPNERLDTMLARTPAFDLKKLAEQLLNFFIERMEDIPVLGVVVKALRLLLDTNGDGDITLEDLIGLFTGRGVLDALASLFGGAGGMSLTSIVEGLKKLFSGLTPGGQFDARRLFGMIFPG